MVGSAQSTTGIKSFLFRAEAAIEEIRRSLTLTLRPKGTRMSEMLDTGMSCPTVPATVKGRPTASTSESSQERSRFQPE